jgi:hypothetical protein
LRASHDLCSRPRGLIVNGVQPRRTKLWLAGSNENWQFAAYELDELIEAFDDVEQYQPEWNSFPIGRKATATLEASFASLN